MLKPGLSAGDPGRIRTCDLQLRRLLLYPLSYGAVRDKLIYNLTLLRPLNPPRNGRQAPGY